MATTAPKPAQNALEREYSAPKGRRTSEPIPIKRAAQANQVNKIAPQIAAKIVGGSPRGIWNFRHFACASYASPRVETTDLPQRHAPSRSRHFNNIHILRLPSR